MEDIKYSVTAYIDLLGFSNHLEISSHDIRTNIGKEAIKRLNILEQVLEKIDLEKEEAPKYFPHSMHTQRINDALILTIDLPEMLMPPIGDLSFNGFTMDGFEKNFDVSKYNDNEEFKKDYDQKIFENTVNLMRFVGLVSRIHLYINHEENKSFFPGAKTIVSSGFRRVFKNKNNQEDFLAANFSFSNAFKAEQFLHGPKFYIDCNILQLMSSNNYIRNVIKAGIFIEDIKPRDPFVASDDFLTLQSESIESPIQTLNLFRKNYFFREIKAYCMCYLQIIPQLTKYINETPFTIPEYIYKNLFLYLLSENVNKEIAKGHRPWIFIELTDNVDDVFKTIVYGKQPIKLRSNGDKYIGKVYLE